MNKETLEEAAKKYAVEVNTKMGGNKETYQNCSRLDFIAGAKWQGEKLYSDKDLVMFMQFILSQETLDNTSSVSETTAMHYIEQFKNK